MEKPPTPEPKKSKKQQLPTIRNTRLTLSLDSRVEEYLRKNNPSYNMLVRMALEEFISVERTWTLDPVTKESKAIVHSLHKRGRRLDSDNPLDN